MSDTFLKPIDFVEIAATPTNPPAGYRRIYSKTDGFTYQLTSAGVETRIDNAAASGGSLLVQDEGSTITTAASSINFVGGGISASAVGTDVTVTMPTPPTPANAAPPAIGVASSTGTTTTEYALEDHTHAHGNQTTPSHHAVATTGANGFMSSTDKTKLDGISTGAQVNQNAYSIITGNTGTASADTPADTIAITGTQGITTQMTDTPDGLVISNSDRGSTAVADHMLDPDAHPQYANVNTFRTIAVSGQSNVVADTTTDTLTLVAGTNITITTDAGTDSITINAAGGGGGTPAGATTNIQFNNAGAFGADSDFSWNSTTNTLLLSGADTGIVFTGITTEPTSPTAGTARLYAKDIAGRIVPKWVGPSGFDYPIQSSIANNNISVWKGGATLVAATFATVIGSMPYTSLSPVAPTIPTLAATNLKTQTRRSVISTSATAGTLAYIRGSQVRMWRGNAAGLGGYYLVHRFALATLVAGMRVFAGVQDLVANPTNIDPTTSTTPGRIGLAINANSGNWNLVHNVTGTTPTIIALGANFPVNNTNLMELVLFAAPNGAGVGYRVTNLSGNLTVSGTISTNQPANTSFLIPTVWVTNNATAAACAIDFVSTYVETDF